MSGGMDDGEGWLWWVGNESVMLAFVWRWLFGG